MAVRPVDSLTMLPRLNEAARQVYQQDQQPLAFQQVLGAQVQEKAARERAQVRQKEQMEQPIIGREKEREGGGGSPQQGGRERRTPAAQPRPAPVTRSGRLDVKV